MASSAPSNDFISTTNPVPKNLRSPEAQGASRLLRFAPALRVTFRLSAVVLLLTRKAELSGSHPPPVLSIARQCCSSKLNLGGQAATILRRLPIVHAHLLEPHVRVFSAYDITPHIWPLRADSKEPA